MTNEPKQEQEPPSQFKCQRSGCGAIVDGELHPCPYAQEIGGSDESCNCCDECRHQCAMDI